ncbi:MAG: S24/S26 family peptidase [Verrucomicrobia bacterium]|nr:S24/S26 family peptidase [Verrucomicrobiota bacterium]MDA1087220.1 S24/S26 family peptidase [Verrucomicrobiota bacterium]
MIRQPLSSPEFESIARELLDDGHAIRFKATGRSMRPFILDGDEVTAKPVSATDLRTGQIVLYRRPSGAVAAHRLVKWSPASPSVAVVAADSGFTETETFSGADILGRIESCRRGSRTIRLDSTFSRTAGLCWYHTRPLRRLLKRLVRYCT